MASTSALLLIGLLGLCLASTLEARPIPEEQPAGNSTARSLLAYQKKYTNVGPWNKASATFFNTWGACHCGWAGENCNSNNQRAVAMPKSFYNAQGGWGDRNTWDGNNGPIFFGERGMCGVCLEVKCMGCHDAALGHAGCSNQFKGCKGPNSSVKVKVLDLLWEGDANRNTVKSKHHDLAGWNDCTNDYCPKGDGSDYAKRIDMYGPAFGDIAEHVTGIIKVEWRFISDWDC